VPPLLDAERYDEIRTIDEAAGRVMARPSAAEEGLFAGTSTGSNVAGAVDIASEMGPGQTVVTVACDTGLKYLAGDLYTT
jgi:cysteine synthase